MFRALFLNKGKRETGREKNEPTYSFGVAGLGLSAHATLADDQNPELCNELWNALPFDSIMNNAVVTDGSMYCWGSSAELRSDSL